MYHSSQPTVSADGLQHSSQHRKMRGIKTAICAPSIRPDLCILSRGFKQTCRRASLASFRGCDPHVAICAESGGLPHRHPLKLVPWLDLGKSESTAGLTFVCLSRAKRLVDLLIEPMPLERLSKIGDTPTFQLRLREEVRLNALAGETLRLHGGVE